MKEFLVTPCSKEKDRSPGLLPAIERYQHPRIEWVYLESKRLMLPMLILSGEFGFLRPIDPIPWYDHALQMDEVPDLVPGMAKTLMNLAAERLRFYARPDSDPGWAPYHEALNQACQKVDVRINWIHWKR